MKKNIFLIIFTFVFLFSPLLLLANGVMAGGDAQENEQKPIVEDITVTNIEVPVRVLYQGKPVADLTRDDFALYENKKRMKINGFFLKRKKLNVKETKEIMPTQGQSQPRTFVLAFRITEFNEHLEKAIEHLFENILKTNDRLLVFTNEKSRDYPDLREKETIKQQVLTVLKEESHRAKQELVVYINKIEALIDLSNFEKVLTPGYKLSTRIHNFLKQYQRVWNDYKKKYLVPRVDRFYFLSRFLENIKGEKWVLNFYQFDLFPNIRISTKFANYLRDVFIRFRESRDYGDQAIAKLCETILEEIMVEMAVGKGFPIEEVSKLFYKVNATFHSFFIRTMNKGNANDIDYIEVSSDIEQTLKRITYFTGGKNITSNNLVQSIETISEVEDVYYLLSYVPQDPKEAGKLNIKVREPKDKEDQYQVLYDDNFNADYITEYFKTIEKQTDIPEIKVVDFSFQGKVLAFTVKDYLMKPVENNNIGRMKIRISLFDKSNNSALFDQQKVLTAQKAEMKVSLGAFKTIKKGEYNFIINAVDMFTGKEDVLHHSINVK